jgi:hypothetical protein
MLGQRQVTRRLFSHYTLVYDDITGRLLGHWIDIGLGGFRLETLRPILPGEKFRFRVDLSKDIAGKSSMIINARSRWCHQHEFDINLYDAGFEIDNLPPDDARIFISMFERYGSSFGGESYAGA